MKSVHFPVKNKFFGFVLAQKETNSILRAKYLTDLMIRGVFELPAVLWVTERETYTRDVDHKIYPNGDRTGEFTREIVILGSVRFGQDVEKVEILVRIMTHAAAAKHIQKAPCWIALYHGQAFRQAYILENENSVHLH